MSPSNKQLVLAGDLLNYASIAVNVCLTWMAMTAWPNKSSYDPWWIPHGFCVVEDAVVPTEVLCYIFLTTSAVATYFLSNRPELASNPLLLKRIQATIFGNAAHGFGHLFLWLMNEPASPVELSLEPAAIANLLMLTAFWIGVLRVIIQAPTSAAIPMSIAILGAQYLLGVPPELGFTYSQSVILLGQSIYQLFRNTSSEDSFLYFAVSAYNLPLFVFYCFEMFDCSTGVLGKLGGHAMYDLYLSLVPFLLFWVVQGEQSATTSKVKSI